MGEAWSERWRNGIRAGETAIVIGLWGSGIATGDIVIAAILLAAGLVVGLVAVATDPIRSRTAKAMVGLALVATFAASEAVVVWRHQRDTVAPPHTPAAAPVVHDHDGLTADEIAKLIRDGLSHQAPAPSTEIVIRDERRPAPPPPAPTADVSPYLEGLIAKRRREAESADARRACMNALYDVSDGLRKLIDDSVKAQNAYANGGDEKAVADAYTKWRAQVLEYLSTNKSKLIDVEEFGRAKDKFAPTVLLIGNTGYQAARRFETHRAALIAINNRYVEGMDGKCAESGS